jgi:hypothetical protein
MISANGKSDADELTIAQGASSSLLLQFAFGIAPDPTGPSPEGLRASLLTSTSFQVMTQGARVDHSTGTLDGVIGGEGAIAADMSLALTLHFSPSNFTPPADDGGSGELPDGAALAGFDFMITGTKQ